MGSLKECSVEAQWSLWLWCICTCMYGVQRCTWTLLDAQWVIVVVFQDGVCKGLHNSLHTSA